MKLGPIATILDLVLPIVATRLRAREDGHGRGMNGLTSMRYWTPLRKL
jgi:hypothetical protein